MKTIRIVTHCYAEKLPQYGIFLRYHLRSLAAIKDVDVRVTVVCCPDDYQATWALNWFVQKHRLFPLQRVHLPRERLFRRAIGRNLAALGSDEDLVWFCDVDYVFSSSCLAMLFGVWESLDPKPAMVYPGTIKIHNTHALGDALVRDFDGIDTTIDPTDFKDHRFNRAIGGVQIIDGQIAKLGYLNATKWQKPVDPSIPFPEFRDDIAYRNWAKAIRGIKRIEFDGVYRLRHSAKTY